MVFGLQRSAASMFMVTNAAKIVQRAWLWRLRGRNVLVMAVSRDGLDKIRPRRFLESASAAQDAQYGCGNNCCYSKQSESKFGPFRRRPEYLYRAAGTHLKCRLFRKHSKVPSPLPHTNLPRTSQTSTMPAIRNHAIELGAVALQARDWSNTVGQSGMTPTAFAFLIPVFVVAIAAPLYVCL